MIQRLTAVKAKGKCFVCGQETQRGAVNENKIGQVTIVCPDCLWSAVLPDLVVEALADRGDSPGYRDYMQLLDRFGDNFRKAANRHAAHEIIDGCVISAGEMRGTLTEPVA